MTPFTKKTFPRILFLVLAAAFVAPVAPASAAPEKIECTTILDQKSGTPILRNGTCDERFTPMSTFKVPLALMGYDAGILKDEHTPHWDYDPKFNAPKRTHKTVDPMIWEEESILWYSQELTRKLGKTSFDAYVASLGYGNADTKGRPGKDDALTQSWLSSSLRISPDEQAQFMRRIVARDLPVARAAIDMTIRVIPSFKTADGWHVQGKTGSGWLRRKNGKFDFERPVGWFVGWAEKDGRRIVFARLRVDNKPAERLGLTVRDEFLGELPALMGGK